MREANREAFARLRGRGHAEAVGEIEAACFALDARLERQERTS